MPKKTKIKGRGIIDTAKKIYDKAKSANDFLKEKKYANKILWSFPEAGNIPYVGWALKLAQKYGYGKMKGRGGEYPTNKILFNTVHGMKY